MAIWQAKSKLDARVSRRCLLLTSLMTTCAPLIARAQEATVPATAAGSARELTEQGLRNLIAFTRLLGYVRHFHPSDQAAAADWEVVAIEGMRRIESCEDTQRLAMALEAFFRPLAPTVQVFPSGMEPEAPSGLVPAAGAADLKVVSWRHAGPGRWRSPIAACPRSTRVNGYRLRCRASSRSSKVPSASGYSRPTSAPASPRACPCSSSRMRPGPCRTRRCRRWRRNRSFRPMTAPPASRRWRWRGTCSSTSIPISTWSTPTGRARW